MNDLKLIPKFLYGGWGSNGAYSYRGNMLSHLQLHFKRMGLVLNGTNNYGYRVTSSGKSNNHNIGSAHKDGFAVDIAGRAPGHMASLNNIWNILSRDAEFNRYLKANGLVLNDERVKNNPAWSGAHIHIGPDVARYKRWSQNQNKLQPKTTATNTSQNTSLLYTYDPKLGYRPLQGRKRPGVLYYTLKNGKYYTIK